MEINDALYYPSVEFSDSIWLTQACFVWDYIYRMVPRNYEPNDSDFVKTLVGEGIIHNIYPDTIDGMLKKVANKFMKLLNEGKWKAEAFSLYKDHTAGSSRLHKDKVDESLRTYLNDNIFNKTDDNEFYLQVPRDFSALYMAYLANELLLEWQGNLAVITDNPALWTGNVFYNFEPIEEDIPKFQVAYDLDYRKFAVLIVKSVLPYSKVLWNINDLIKIRNNIKSYKINFLNAVKDVYNWATGRNGIVKKMDPQILNLKLNIAKKELECEIAKYEQSINVTYAIPISVRDNETIERINDNGNTVIGITNNQTNKKNLPSNKFSVLLDTDKEFQNLEPQEYVDKRLVECIHQFIVD